MANAKTGGLGPRGSRGLDALFESSVPRAAVAPVAEQQVAEDKAAEAARAEEERRAKEAREIAAAQEEAARVAQAAADRAAQEEAARAAALAAAAASTTPAVAVPAMPEISEAYLYNPEALAESIDVKFSLSEPEITERAPRKNPPTPVENRPSKTAVREVAPMPIMDGAIAEIALDYIETNPFQPRLRFKQEPLDELAASIARDGLVQPITVRPLPGGRFQIISGERRFRASQLAGRRSIPAYIREVADREMGQFALVENLQREDLNPIEAAIGYRNLMKSQNLTQSEVAQLLCKGRSTIANTLRLLDLPEDLQEMIYNEQLTEGHARAIQAVPSAEGRKKLADKVVAENLSVRATENLARLMCGRPVSDQQAEKAERASVPAAFKAIARSMTQHLGTKVKVKNAGGKNKLEIEFADAAELERICAQIMNGEPLAPAAEDGVEANAEETVAETAAE